MRRPGPSIEQLLLEQAELIRALGRSVLGDAASADDVVQETWLRAATGARADDANVRGWLARIARNVAFSMRLSRRRRGERERRAARPDLLPSAADVAARVELQRKVSEAVQRLEEPYRSAVVLRYFEGLAPAEIAARLGVPVKTVATRLHRALEMLRDRLGAERGARRGRLAHALLPAALRAAAARAATVLAMKKIVAVVVPLLIVALVALRGVATREPSRAGAPPPEALARASGGAPEPAAGPVAGRLREGEPMPAFTFAGRVVDEAGRGVAGASVRLGYWRPPPLGETLMGGTMGFLMRRDRERHESPGTTADGDGYFRIDRPHGSVSFLRAEAEGFAPGLAGPCESGSFVTIALPRAPRLRVEVVDPDGVAVEGAEVRIATVGARDFTAQSREVLATSRTGPDGAASLPMPPAPETVLEVDPREPHFGFVARSVRAEGTLRVEVPRVTTQEWKIVDAESGAPLPDAYVLVGESGLPRSWFGEPVRRRFSADALGVVRCPAQDGYYLRLATAPGHEILPVDREVMPLRRAMRISGQVIDAEGRPVPGAAILAANQAGFLWDLFACLPLVRGFTDEGGRFAIEIAVLASEYSPKPDPGYRSLVVLSEGRGMAVEEGIAVVAGGRRVLTIRLPAPASLELEIVRPTGEPVPEQWLQIVREIPRPPSWPAEPFEVGVDLVSLLSTELDRTDRRGRFSASPLAPGRYRIRAENTTLLVDLAEGRVERARMVKGAGLVVRGVVLDADGRPAAKRPVGLAGPVSTSKSTDERGAFRFDDVEPGDYSIFVLPEGWFNPLFVNGVKPGDDLVIRIPAGQATLRVRVDGAEPGAEVEYGLSTETGGRHRSDGAWATLGREGQTLPFTPGDGLLVVRAKGRGWGWTRFAAPPARTTDVHVALAPAGSIVCAGDPRLSAIARRLDGLPDDLGDRERGLLDQLGVASVPATPDAEGRFRFDDLPPGRYRVSLGSHRDGRFEERAGADVEVAPGAVVELVLDAPR